MCFIQLCRNNIIIHLLTKLGSIFEHNILLPNNLGLDYSSLFVFYYTVLYNIRIEMKYRYRPVNKK